MRVPAPVTLAVTILTRYFLNSQKRARHVPEREILDFRPSRAESLR
jgi:hypothetical protein